MGEKSILGYRFDAGPSVFTMPHLIDELFELCGKNPRDYFNYELLDPDVRLMLQVREDNAAAFTELSALRHDSRRARRCVARRFDATHHAPREVLRKRAAQHLFLGRLREQRSVFLAEHLGAVGVHGGEWPRDGHPFHPCRRSGGIGHSCSMRRWATIRRIAATNAAVGAVASPSMLALRASARFASHTVALDYDIPTFSSTVSILVTDLTGRTVHSEQHASVLPGSFSRNLELGAISAGTYFVTLRACGVSQTVRVQIVD